MTKHIANILTACRILGGIVLLFFPAFSAAFYITYLFCGFSDMIDGTVARKTKSVSAFGAKFDTVADTVFAVACFVKLLPFMHFPAWLWIWVVAVAAIKIGNAVWEWICNRRLVSIHSGLNKATGFLLFLFPLTLGFIAPVYSAVTVCAAATVSAIHEVYLTRTGREVF